MFAFLRPRRFDSHPPSVIDAPLLDMLAEARDAAVADADEAFTPDRAAAQRAAILARLGATADPRVLSFPPRVADAPQPAPRPARAPRPALGWMLTAAAAGLVVGVGTGQGIYDWQPRTSPAQARTTAVPVSAPAPVMATDPDDAILGEVEVALAERGVDELQPLDALTPRVTLVATR